MLFLRHNPTFLHGFFEPSTVLMAGPLTKTSTTAKSPDDKRIYRSIDAQVNETDDSYALTMDLPGVKPDKLNIQVHGGALRIAAERATVHGSSVVPYRQRFALDEDIVDVDNLKASLADGVLSVHIPKKEAARPINVPVIEGEVAESMKEDLRITFDVPGVKAEDLKVVVRNGVLSVQGERKKGNSCYSRIQRTMTLDRHRMDLSLPKAYLADGVLTFTAPQKEQPSVKTIRLDREKNAMEG